MIVQIYSITTPEEARTLSEMGVDHIGVIVGKASGTYTQDFVSTNKIFESILPTTKKVAFSKSNVLSELIEICNETNPDILHISAFENITNNLLMTLKSYFPKIQLMKSIYINDERSVEEALYFQEFVHFLLLDSQSTDSSFGATGITNDWNIARKIVKKVRVPVILAGGLGIDNVIDAIKTVCPAGVDSMTKTNLANSKRKDPNKVRQFINLAKSVPNISAGKINSQLQL